MHSLADHAGSWTGTNTFRLMPTDEPFEAPFTASVSLAAGGNIATIAYTWSHPADGAQDGFLVVGPDEEPAAAVAFWGDSWHQAPAPKAFHGAIDGPVTTVGYEYAGDWRWEIIIDASAADALALRMDNIVPASAVPDGTGPVRYAAMITNLRRA